jgi:hypothetical protein
MSLRRHYNLILMAVWLAVGIALVAPELFPEKMQQHLKAAGGGIVAMLAFVFAAYNAARWWAYQSLYRNRVVSRRTNPLSVRGAEPEKPYEHNPELDFFKPRDDG